MLGFCWYQSRLTALGCPGGGAYRFWFSAVGFQVLEGQCGREGGSLQPSS